MKTKIQSKLVPALFFVLWLVCVLCLVGCATQRTHLEEIHPDGTRKVSDTVTRTFFDSKSDLAKLKTSHTDKTQSIGITGLDQESSGSNAVSLVEHAVGAAVSAGVKAAKRVP